MSFSVKLTPKDRATGRFMSRVHRALIKAVNKAKDEKQMTQVQIAEAMGVDKSAVTRFLCGEGNLTLKTIGDISWAVGLRPEILFHPISVVNEPLANNHAIQPPVVIAVPQPRLETTRPVEIPHAVGFSARTNANRVVIKTEVGVPAHAH